MSTSERLRTGALGPMTLLFAALAFAPACSSKNNEPPNSAAGENSPERNDAVARLDKSAAIVANFRDKVPYEVAKEVRCVIVIPGMVQGGLIFGGRGGRGFADCRNGGSNWSVPAPVSISGGSFGAQIGVQSADLLALVMTDKARSALMTGRFQMGVDASAAAGTVGTGASTDFKLGSDVLTYVESQGLFAGATFTGGTIGRDDDATKALYGGLPEVSELLGGTPMPMPGAAAGRFVEALKEAFGPTARPAAELLPHKTFGI